MVSWCPKIKLLVPPSLEFAASPYTPLLRSPKKTQQKQSGGFKHVENCPSFNWDDVFDHHMFQVPPGSPPGGSFNARSRARGHRLDVLLRPQERLALADPLPNGAPCAERSGLIFVDKGGRAKEKGASNLWSWKWLIDFEIF